MSPMSALCFQLKDGTAFREKDSQKRIMGWTPTHVWEPQQSHGCSGFSPDHHQQATCMLRQGVQSQDSLSKAHSIQRYISIHYFSVVWIYSQFPIFEKGSTLSSKSRKNTGGS